MTEIVLSMADLERADLTNAIMQRAELGHANLQRADLRYADLGNAELWMANLQHANLFFANLEGAHLIGANLQGSKLVGANLVRADFRKAKFDENTVLPDNSKWSPGADITRFANPEHPDFLGTIALREGIMTARFEEVDLRGLDMRGANLQGINMTGIDLRGANLTGAKFDENSIMPDGTRWVQGADLRRFTEPEHPDFWQSYQFPV